MTKHKDKKPMAEPINEQVLDMPATQAGLPDPYGGFVGKPQFRLNVVVVTDDMLTIKSVCPSKGTIQHLVAGYVKSIADELRSRGLNFYSPENTEELRRIIERRNRWEQVQDHADTGSARSSSSRHDTRPKGAIRRGAKNS